MKITDFGIAHAAWSAPITQTGALVGTPAYLAPERVMGGPATPASDLYSLGVVGYQCLTGTVPFAGIPHEVTAAHRHRTLPPLPPAVPAGVAELVLDLTARDPAARPASAGEVAARAGRLRDALAGRPTAAPPASEPGGPPPARAMGAEPVTLAGDPVPLAGDPVPLAGGPVPGPETGAPGRRARPVGWRAGPLGWRAGPAGRGAGHPGRRVAAGHGRRPPAAAAGEEAARAGRGAGRGRRGGRGWPGGMAAGGRLRSRAAAGPAGRTAACRRHAERRRRTPAPGRRTPTAPAARSVEVNADALAGQQASVVSQQLRQMGLRPRVVGAVRGGQAPGTVISVQPSGQVPAGSIVTVTAARPPPGQGNGDGNGQGNNGD